MQRRIGTIRPSCSPIRSGWSESSQGSVADETRTLGSLALANDKCGSPGLSVLSRGSQLSTRMPRENILSQPHSRHMFERLMRAQSGTSCQRGTTPECSLSEIRYRASTRSTKSSIPPRSMQWPPKELQTRPGGEAMRLVSASSTRERCSTRAARAASFCSGDGRHAAWASSSAESFGGRASEASGDCFCDDSASPSSRMILVISSIFLSLPRAGLSRTATMAAVRCGLLCNATVNSSTVTVLFLLFAGAVAVRGRLGLDLRAGDDGLRAGGIEAAAAAAAAAAERRRPAAFLRHKAMMTPTRAARAEQKVAKGQALS
jgi:hypothetical protein